MSGQLNLRRFVGREVEVDEKRVRTNRGGRTCHKVQRSVAGDGGEALRELNRLAQDHGLSMTVTMPGQKTSFNPAASTLNVTVGSEDGKWRISRLSVYRPPQ